MKPKNVQELRDSLCEMFNKISTDKKFDLSHGKVAANLAGKVISTVRTQLEYAAQRNETPHIPFMQVPK